jgi:hypothetical protein
MTKVLELPEFVYKDGMPKVQVGCGGIKSGLDTKSTAFLESVNQLSLYQDFLGAAPYQLEII